MVVLYRGVVMYNNISCRVSSMGLINYLSSLSHLKTPSLYHPTSQRLNLFASLSTNKQQQHHQQQDYSLSLMETKQSNSRWRPMCLYYTQGKCTKLGDASHIEKFNHNCCHEFDITSGLYEKIRAQNLDYFLVLDLEGKVEILEFPVLMVDAKTLAVVDIFHRFVRPSVMSEERINDYIKGKYGKMGVDRVWHDTAIPFDEVISHFEAWMSERSLWSKGTSGRLTNAAFVTCGNWDLKTKIPQQCKVVKMKLPPYFMEWINLKDVYLNFYQREARGMLSMMRGLQIQPLGSHHLGIDDTKNITRVLQRMLVDGAILQITAWRNPNNLEKVEFLFVDRI